MRLIAAQTYRRMPWKNGGGETIQIAIDDAARGLDDFAWRISMATVASDGPFSLFPEVDRTLCVLDGAGIDLVFDAAPPVALTPQSAPFAFPGDVAVQSRLHGGAITDLNIMTRRGRARHVVTVARGDGPFVVRRHGDLLVLFNAGSAALTVHNDGAATLGSRDCAVLEGVDDSVRIVSPASHLVCIDLWLS